jgi:hypothetical protein
MNHIPQWLWFKVLDKMMEYRPQCTFLPLITNRGTVKPARQVSLHLADQFPQPLKDIVGPIQGMKKAEMSSVVSEVAKDTK